MFIHARRGIASVSRNIAKRQSTIAGPAGTARHVAATHRPAAVPARPNASDAPNAARSPFVSRTAAAPRQHQQRGHQHAARHAHAQNHRHRNQDHQRVVHARRGHARRLGQNGVVTVGQDLLAHRPQHKSHRRAQRQCRQRIGAGQLFQLPEQERVPPRGLGVPCLHVDLLAEEAPRERGDEEDADRRVAVHVLAPAQPPDRQRRAKAEDDGQHERQVGLFERRKRQRQQPRRPRAAKPAMADAFAHERPAPQDDEDAQQRARDRHRPRGDEDVRVQRVGGQRGHDLFAPRAPLQTLFATRIYSAEEKARSFASGAGGTFACDG